MAIEFYWGSGSPFAWRVMLALAIKKIPYESKLLSFTEREHQAPEYLAVNPRGKVPALRDGEVTMYESTAMLAYLEAKHPEPALFGHTPAQTGEIWRHVCEMENYLGPAALRLLGRFFTAGELDGEDARLQARAAELRRELERLAEHLVGRAWVVGETVSAADITLYPTVALLDRVFGKEHQDNPLLSRMIPIREHYASLGAWMARIEGLDGFDQTYPPHWR